MRSSQEQSRFFARLLSEIRLEIYKFCFPLLEYRSPPLPDFNVLHQRVYRTHIDIPSLLLTCKRIHDEAKPIICAIATLSLHGGLRGPNSILPTFIHGIFPFKLSLVRDLHVELMSYYWCGPVTLAQFFEACKEDLGELHTIRVYLGKYDSGYRDRPNRISEDKVPMLSSQKQVVQDLASFILGSSNLKMITFGGYPIKGLKEDLELLKTRVNEGERKIKVLFSLEEEYDY